MVDKTKSRQAPLTLDQLTEALEDHAWSFMADNYQSYFTAIQREQELFRMAQALSKPGVDEYRWAQIRAINDMIFKKEMAVRDQLTSFYTAKIDALKAQYMTPLDHYKEELSHHDWTYNYSDDHGMWTRGLENEKRLIAKAREGGEAFMEAFAEAYRKHHQAGFDWNKEN